MLMVHGVVAVGGVRVVPQPARRRQAVQAEEIAIAEEGKIRNNKKENRDKYLIIFKS